MAHFVSPPRIYLAGPDVFFPDAPAHFQSLQARCTAMGLVGVPPSDGGLSEGGVTVEGGDMAERIYQANVALLRSCDGVLANLMPFRGAIEPDSGTVFEVGMAIAWNKPVAAVLPQGLAAYADQVARHVGVRRDAQGLAWDVAQGFLVEEFGQPLNLMLSRSAQLFTELDAALLHLKRVLTSL